MRDDLKAAAVAGAMALSYMAYFHLVYVIQNAASGVLMHEYTDVAAGTAAAPFQFRPFVPETVVWLSRNVTALEPQHWVTVTNTTGFFLAVVAIAGLLWVRHRSLATLPLVVGFMVFWGVGAFLVVSPETFVSVGLVSAVGLTLRRRSRWEIAGFVGACLGLLGTRADLVVMLAVALAVEAAITRDRMEWLWAAAVGGAGGAALVLWKLVYPDAHYLADVPFVQISYNFGTWRTALPVLMAAPLMGALWKRLRDERDDTWADDFVLMVWPAVFFLVSLVVARPSESRLFLPFAGLLALVAIPGWVDTLRRGIRSDSSRCSAASASPTSTELS